ncbi:metallophosphatase domain-containing protein [Leptolyngbya sp. 7M]|uniref:metallophosphatase domain-containing protein n=1 Tax=Leptolyngbya sp. 7M TaxID=2812896 RepID=UPI001B8D6A15|nr:metallophosphatase domain-containing protein [Leptolyngbya sp. 7M]QYO65656.1 metallophosphatase domain-containing protein [Leptolyngbya sp. 7M]
MRIVCISDTHNCNEQINVPEGDLLIHSGDATITGTTEEIRNFTRWFAGLPHKNKIFVAGNHDWLFEREPRSARQLLDASIIYLQDSAVTINGFHIYGSPWQPRFYDWAFNLMRGPELAKKWAMIPEDIDILITHGPPHGILDEVPRQWGIENTGCEELGKRVDKIASGGRLKLHIFGHIHCGYGTYEKFGVKFINASTCDEQYKPTQPAIVIDI